MCICIHLYMYLYAHTCVYVCNIYMIYIICTYDICHIYVYIYFMCMQCQGGQKRDGFRTLGFGIIDDCELPCGGWEPNPGSLNSSQCSQPLSHVCSSCTYCWNHFLSCNLCLYDFRRSSAALSRGSTCGV